jgi:hypothetical protein
MLPLPMPGARLHADGRTPGKFSECKNFGRLLTFSPIF